MDLATLTIDGIDIHTGHVLTDRVDGWNQNDHNNANVSYGGNFPNRLAKLRGTDSLRRAVP